MNSSVDISSLYYWCNVTVITLMILYFFWELRFLIIAATNTFSEVKSSKISKFLFVVCAKNEEDVIERALDSIKSQKYPKEKIDILVVADNCTDKTAQIAINLGANVLEKQDSKIGKGYALDFAFKYILKNYIFDAVIVLDADNIIGKDFSLHMNNSFCSGQNIVSPFRNSKSFSSSLVAACNGIWFLRDAGMNNFGHYLCGNQCTISGTGFLISRSIIENLQGYPFYTLCEDLQFSAYACYSDYRICYNDNAVVYDIENGGQINFDKQHKRWLKGFLQVITVMIPNCIKGAFRRKTRKYCLDISLRLSVPALIIVAEVVMIVFSTIMSFITNRALADIWLLTLFSLFIPIVGAIIMMCIFGIISLVKFWDRIEASKTRKIISIIVYPFCQILNIPYLFMAIFQKNKWSKIERK